MLNQKTYENQEVCSEECVLHKLVQETHLAPLVFARVLGAHCLTEQQVDLLSASNREIRSSRERYSNREIRIISGNN